MDAEPKPGKTILFVEDHGPTRRAVAKVLSAAGHRVLESDGVEVAFQIFQVERPDLVLLDLSLVDGNGVDLCRKIRAHKNLATTPVIMITGKGGLDEKAVGFDAGADQYLVKPVAPREVLMWVQALLHRLAFNEDEGGALVADDVTIEPDAHLVRFQQTTISNLTGKEFDLLYTLVKKRPKVLSRQWVLSTLWRTVAVDNVVDTHIGNLRHKLPQALADRLQTVPGKGYRYFA